MYFPSLFLGLKGETSFPIKHLILDELSCNTWKLTVNFESCFFTVQLFVSVLCITVTMSINKVKISEKKLILSTSLLLFSSSDNLAQNQERGVKTYHLTGFEHTILKMPVLRCSIFFSAKSANFIRSLVLTADKKIILN